MEIVLNVPNHLAPDLASGTRHDRLFRLEKALACARDSAVGVEARRRAHDFTGAPKVIGNGCASNGQEGSDERVVLTYAVAHDARGANWGCGDETKLTNGRFGVDGLALGITVVDFDGLSCHMIGSVHMVRRNADLHLFDSLGGVEVCVDDLNS